MANKVFNPNDWTDVKPATQPGNSDKSDMSDICRDVEMVVGRIENSGKDITSDYNNWLNIGFGFADSLGEYGRSLFHRVSRFYPSYDEKTVNDQYSVCLKSKRSGVTIKTFFQLAKEAGIDISSSSQTTSHDTHQSDAVGSVGNVGNEFVNCSNTLCLEDADDTMPTFSNEIYEELPQILQTVVENCDNASEADMMILGVLATVSAVIPNYVSIYYRRTIGPNLYFFCTAPASTGKGKLDNCNELVRHISDEWKSLWEEKVQQYEEEALRLKEEKNTAELSRLKCPEEPRLVISGNTTSTRLYQILDANGGMGLVIESEADSVASTFQSDYGNCSDLYRKAFHHEPISLNRVRDNLSIYISRPRLSVVLAGTPNQVVNLIHSAENGLLSRFMFYYRNLEDGWVDVFSRCEDQPLSSVYEEMGEKVFELYHRFLNGGNVTFYLTSKQRDDFNAFFAANHAFYKKVFGSDFVPSIRRHALSVFRCMMILTALRQIPTSGILPPVLVCTDADFHVGMCIAQCLLVHIGKVYTMFLKGPHKEIKPGVVGDMLLFESLPDCFQTKDAMKKAQELRLIDDVSNKNQCRKVERWLKSWKDHGTVNPDVKSGHYVKTHQTLP